MEFQSHNRVLEYRSLITAYNAGEEIPPPPNTKIRLLLVSVTDQHHITVTDQNPSTEQTLGVVLGRWSESTVDVDRLGILNPLYPDRELYRVIRSELLRSHECLRGELCSRGVLKRLVLSIIKKLRSFVERRTKPWKIRVIKIHNFIKLRHVIHGRLLVKNSLQRSTMKNNINYDEEEEECVVCLEELKLNCEDQNEVLRMPCSHRFHTHCILKWLNTSHFCPICRFEIPTKY